MSTTVLDGIVGGQFDDQLDQLDSAIRARRKIVEARKLDGLKPGDTVRFNNRTKPKYLIGLEAKVIRINKTRAVVKITDEFSAGRFHGEVTVPPELLEVA